jgi:hypothetical protein
LDYLLVIDNATGESKLMSLDAASFRTGIAADEIDYAIAETGSCNSIHLLIIDTRSADEVNPAS